MPIYEYDCPKCGRFDVIQKMSSTPLEDPRRLRLQGEEAVSAGSFAFKGSGFHQTDYKKAGLRAAPALSPACASCPSAKA